MPTPRSASRKASTVAPSAAPATIDYASLSVEVEDLDPITRARDVDYGPFVAWLQASKDENKGRAIVVHADAEKAHTSLIRRCASSLGMGAAIQVVPADNGNVKIRFQGKEKRHHDSTKPRKPTRKDSWSPAEYAAELRLYVKSVSEWLTQNGQTDKIDPLRSRIQEEIKALNAEAKSA